MESSERSHLGRHPTSIKGVLLLDGRVLLVKNLRDEMKITVIATGFGEEAVAIASAAGVTAMPSTAPRFVQRPADDLPRPMMQGARSDDLDVPTFIRKKAD